MSLLNFNRNDASAKDTQNNNNLPRIIRIDISEIETSHVNPRHSRGEHYESTKASIRNIGLQSILTITRLPGATNYSLYNGGNTRLAILKELLEEYLIAGEKEKAEQIRFQQCQFVPYTDDLDLLIKHMAENEERSGMTFIDKARAVFNIRHLYLKQHNVESVSNNQLVKYIHSLGWTRVNQPSMTELTYAFDHLSLVIPKSLDAGLGKAKVNKIRTWLNLIEQYLEWLLSRNDYNYNIEQARQLYYNTLAEYDDDLEPLDLDLFFENYRYRLADVLTQFDRSLTSTAILQEIRFIEENGYVCEEMSHEELSRRLDETSDMPPAVFPKPRKPRSTSSSTEAENSAPGSDDGETVNQNADSAAGIRHSGQALHDTIPSVVINNPEMLEQIAQRKEAERKAQNSSATAKMIMPFGAPLDPPNIFLPKNELNAQVRSRCHELYRHLLNLINHELLVEIIDLELHPITQETPYFYLNLSNEEKFTQLQNLFQDQAFPKPQKFATLIFFSLWNFYTNFIFQPDTDAQEYPSILRAQHLWQECASIYHDYSLWCRTGLLFSHITAKEEVVAIGKADQINLHLLALIHTIETKQDIGE